MTGRQKNGEYTTTCTAAAAAAEVEEGRTVSSAPLFRYLHNVALILIPESLFPPPPPLCLLSTGNVNIPYPWPLTETLGERDIICPTVNGHEGRGGVARKGRKEGKGDQPTVDDRLLIGIGFKIPKDLITNHIMDWLSMG